MSKQNYGFAARLILAACALSQIALGATLCVNKNGTKGCSSTIGAAVASASAGDVIQVSKGTYHEDVVIRKSISLIGANSSNTIIDATGMSNGVYVDGLDNAAVGVVGISDVLVSGFTIQNANYEGILVTNATRITINGNQVVKIYLTYQCPWAILSHGRSQDPPASNCALFRLRKLPSGDDEISLAGW